MGGKRVRIPILLSYPKYNKKIDYEWVENDSSKVNLATSTIKILKKLEKNQDKV
jgi:hypothetical protein